MRNESGNEGILKKAEAMIQKNQIEKGFDLLYDAIVRSGPDAFDSKDDFSAACKLTTEICLKHDDYVNSNNILQSYKHNYKKRIDRDPWHARYSILVYGVRTPTYYIKTPKKLAHKIEDAHKGISTEKIDYTLSKVMDFYIDKLASRFEDDLRSEFLDFTDYFIKDEFKDFNQFQFALNELRKFLNQDIDYEDIEIIPPEDSKVYDEYPDIFKRDLSSQDETMTAALYIENPELHIIGNASVNKQTMEKIASNYGFSKNQLEFKSYDEIKNRGIDKYIQSHRYSQRVAAIIVGPVPHKVKGMKDHSSLIEALKNTQGAPFTIEAKDKNGNLRISKTSFETAVKKVHEHIQAIA